MSKNRVLKANAFCTRFLIVDTGTLTQNQG